MAATTGNRHPLVAASLALTATLLGLLGLTASPWFLPPVPILLAASWAAWRGMSADRFFDSFGDGSSGPSPFPPL